MADGVALLKSD